MSELRVSDFVKAPGFRSKADGENSGEWFRDAILAPKLKAAISENEKLASVSTVLLDTARPFLRRLSAA